MLRIEDGYRQTRNGAVRKKRADRTGSIRLAIAMLALIGVSIALMVTRVQMEDMKRANEALKVKVQTLSEHNVKLVSEMDGLEQRAIDAELDMAAVEEDLEKALTDLGNAKRELAEVTRERDSLKQSRTAGVTRMSNSKGWSESKVRSTLTAACDKYGVTGSDRTWLVDTGVKVAWGESRFNPAARNGTCLGIMQFNSGWGPAEKRLDPVWSLYRFVRVFVEGGRAKINQHWAATV